MSGIEERLMRDIAAVTGGIAMTESDLTIARDVLDERIEGRRRRTRRGYAAAAAAAAVLIVTGGVVAYQVNGDDAKAVGPTSPGQGLPEQDAEAKRHLRGGPATADVLKGVWRVDNGTAAVQFRADGTMTFDDDGTLFGKPDTTGAWTAEGDLITLTTATSDDAECVGTQIRLWTSTPESGRIHTALVDDVPAVCNPIGKGNQALERLLPTASAFKPYVSEFAVDDGWEPLTDSSVLHGIFFSAEDYLLELDLDTTGPNKEAAGRYYVVGAFDSIVDQGTWGSERGELTLTSSAGSAACQEGDRLAFGDVELLRAGTLAFRGTIAENDCGGKWTTNLWLLVPQGVG